MKRGSMKASNARTLCALIAIALVGVGVLFSTGLGTPSSFGIDLIATVCPVGILESFLAKWVITPHGLICIAVTAVLVILFGKAFCGWICPVPLSRRIFGGHKNAQRDHSDLKDDPKLNTTGRCTHDCTACKLACADTVSSITAAAASSTPATEDQASQQGTGRKGIRIRNSKVDTRLAVLFGALASSAIFGFPVFCLVCPVGLTIATFIALIRLFSLGETTISLIVFPLIVVLELVFFRKWCHRFCPISAALSFASKANRTLKPTVDPSKCLREKGVAECHACYNACPEAIDLHDLEAGAPANECMKCRECLDACPAGAITFPFAPVAVREGTRVMLATSDAQGAQVLSATQDPSEDHMHSVA